MLIVDYCKRKDIILIIMFNYSSKLPYIQKLLLIFSSIFINIFSLSIIFFSKSVYTDIYTEYYIVLCILSILLNIYFTPFIKSYFTKKEIINNITERKSKKNLVLKDTFKYFIDIFIPFIKLWVMYILLCYIPTLIILLSINLQLFLKILPYILISIFHIPIIILYILILTMYYAFLNPYMLEKYARTPFGVMTFDGGDGRLYGYETLCILPMFLTLFITLTSRIFSYFVFVLFDGTIILALLFIIIRLLKYKAN